MGTESPARPVGFAGEVQYGLLAARLAAETVSTAFVTGCFSAEQLSAYECAWKSLLADERRQAVTLDRFNAHYVHLLAAKAS